MGGGLRGEDSSEAGGWLRRGSRVRRGLRQRRATEGWPVATVAGVGLPTVDEERRWWPGRGGTYLICCFSLQSDYVNSMKAARDFSSKMSDSLKVQFLFLHTVGAVFIVCLILTSSIWISAITLLVLTMIIIDMLVTLLICLKYGHPCEVNSGDRGSRTKVAVSTMGASVFSVFPGDLEHLWSSSKIHVSQHTKNISGQLRLADRLPV
ncbi:hypothetical protein BHM03_00011463 [Ensete ventricosum]|nr:hypothetical protein BHM03_00011463 [Ensete ventricosum]